MITKSAAPSPTPLAGTQDQPFNRRALVFFPGHQDRHRHPLFSTSEVFCGPDAETRRRGPLVSAIKTPLGHFDASEVLVELPADQWPEFVVVSADSAARVVPTNLESLPGAKILLVGNTQNRAQPLRRLIQYAQEQPFDFIIFTQERQHARWFAEAGLERLYWLPALECNFLERPLAAAPSRQLIFTGLANLYHSSWAGIAEKVRAANLPLQQITGSASRAADAYADSQITLNSSLNGELGLRVFETLAAGGFLLTDHLAEDSGFSRLFIPGQHLDTWRTQGELIEKIRHYLDHPAEAQRIRAAGRAEVLKRHHPNVKLREFHALINSEQVNPLYDLGAETWWPHGTVIAAPGFSHDLAVYETLRQTHSVVDELTVFAADPDSLARFATLPRLRLASFEELPPPSAGIRQFQLALWWTEDTPAEILARFCGDLVLVASQDAATRPELSAWGFAQLEPNSPVWTLVQPGLFLEEAWKLGAKEMVKARSQGSLSGIHDSSACLTLAAFAEKSGDRALQRSALMRAVGLDRSNQSALVELAIMAREEGSTLAAYSMLEEANRVSPLPPEADRIRMELLELNRGNPEAQGYLRTVGRVPAPAAERPRRILLVTNLLPPQDASENARIIWDHARGLISRGHEVRILAGGDLNGPKNPTDEDSAVYSRAKCKLRLLGPDRDSRIAALTDAGDSLADSHNQSLIRQAIEKFRPDLLLAGNLEGLGVGPVSAALGENLPVIHLVTGCSPGYPVEAQPAAPLYCIAACSDWCATALQQGGYAPARLETIRPGVRVDQFFRLLLPDKSKLRICFSGPVTPAKGAQVLVTALVRMHLFGVKFKAEIGGEAPDPQFLAELDDMVRNAGADEKVKFIGALDHAGLVSMYARSNVAVFPSEFPEPSGISQAEALASGLVVVSSATGGAGEIISHFVNGIVFESAKELDLAEKLLALSQDPVSMSSMQRAGQARAVELSVESAVARLETLIESLLKQAVGIPA